MVQAKPQIRRTLVDRVVGYFSPRAGIERLAARATFDQVMNLTGQGGYDAGKNNRLNRGRFGANIDENAVPREQIARMRWESWELFRNNAHARKIVRSLEAKVVGRGLHPQSQATHEDGTANVEFRERCQQIWNRAGMYLDARGLPGKGGQSNADLQKLALRAVILGGEMLYKFVPISLAEMRRKGLPIPLQLRMIHPARLVDLWLYKVNEGAAKNNVIYRGIELTPDGDRAAYWLYNRHPSEPMLKPTDLEPERCPADEIGHLYVAEDIDQLRGVPWFAPAIMQMRDTGDYQYNELKASALAACVVMGYRRSTGQTNFGLQTQDEPDWDLCDSDGNKITAMQPGMILDLGQNGAIDGFNPARPNTNAEAWINHLIRSTATGVAGVKASTLTGDYRNSSFSSEKSADNDVWPELEGLQDWMATGYCQPIYVQVMRAAQLAGQFDDVISNGEFLARSHELLAANWQGPVARHLNPKDDAEAAEMRTHSGNSSPQQEMAKQGLDWRAQIRAVREYLGEFGFSGEELEKSLREYAKSALGVGLKQLGPVNPNATELINDDSQTEEQLTLVG